jgi:hypothetical protein
MESKMINQVTLDLGTVKNVVVNVTTSGSDGVVEFAYASVYGNENPELTPDQIDEAMEALENGMEENVVCILKAEYDKLGVKFDVGEYKFNQFSPLYDANAQD